MRQSGLGDQVRLNEHADPRKTDTLWTVQSSANFVKSWIVSILGFESNLVLVAITPLCLCSMKAV